MSRVGQASLTCLTSQTNRFDHISVQLVRFIASFVPTLDRANCTHVSKSFCSAFVPHKDDVQRYLLWQKYHPRDQVFDATDCGIALLAEMMQQQRKPLSMSKTFDTGLLKWETMTRPEQKVESVVSRVHCHSTGTSISTPVDTACRPTSSPVHAWSIGILSVCVSQSLEPYGHPQCIMLLESQYGGRVTHSTILYQDSREYLLLGRVDASNHILAVDLTDIGRDYIAGKLPGDIFTRRMVRYWVNPFHVLRQFYPSPDGRFLAVLAESAYGGDPYVMVLDVGNLRDIKLNARQQRELAILGTTMHERPIHAIQRMEWDSPSEFSFVVIGETWSYERLVWSNDLDRFEYVKCVGNVTRQT